MLVLELSSTRSETEFSETDLKAVAAVSSKPSMAICILLRGRLPGLSDSPIVEYGRAAELPVPCSPASCLVGRSASLSDMYSPAPRMSRCTDEVQGEGASARHDNTD